MFLVWVILLSAAGYFYADNFRIKESWFWAGAPWVGGLIYVLSGLKDKRRERLIERWRRAMADRPKEAAEEQQRKQAEAAAKLGPHRKPKKKKTKYEVGPPKKLASIPAALTSALARAGSGSSLGHYELVPNVAYLSVFAANESESSDYQSVVMKLEDKAPTFSVRPLPIVEGRRVDNTGVKFAKDPTFMGLFLVEGAHPKPIGKWLNRPIREALCDTPDVWLRVQDQTLTLTLYGKASAEQLMTLVATADVLCAEYGADGGPSLFGSAISRPEPTADREEDDDDDEEGGEQDEEEADEDEDEETDEDGDDGAAPEQAATAATKATSKK
jgi:hypothetical protein